MTLGFTGALGHNFRPVWANDIDAAAENAGEAWVLSVIMSIT